MDVVFVNPPNHPFTPPGILIEPIDALGLASFAQAAGHRVRLLDMDVRQIAPSGMDAALGGAWPDAVVVVCDYHIPLHADGANGQVGAIVAEARRHGCRTMVGGKLATFGGDGDLRSAGADVYAAHDAEPVLAAALALPEWTPETLAGVPNAAVRRADGGYVRTPAARPRVDLASLPEADRSLVQLSDYIDVRTVLSSRGCHQRCSFCHVPGFWGGWHGRPAESVAAEIGHLATRHGARKVLFLDDNALVDQKRMGLIASLVGGLGLGVALGCLGSVSRFSPGLLETMRDGGFRWIHYGAESGDDRVLLEMGKRTTADGIRMCVAATRAAGLRVRTSWIMDPPGIDADGLKRTEDLILATQSEEIRLHFLALRLGSALRAEHAGLASTQFIHQACQGVSLAAASPEEVAASLARILAALAAGGYAVVRDPGEFADVRALRRRSPGLKIVSLCPMRYGLGWQ